MEALVLYLYIQRERENLNGVDGLILVDIILHYMSLGYVNIPYITRAPACSHTEKRGSPWIAAAGFHHQLLKTQRFNGPEAGWNLFT
jgi:hypothetical protein